VNDKHKKIKKRLSKGYDKAVANIEKAFTKLIYKLLTEQAQVLKQAFLKHIKEKKDDNDPNDDEIKKILDMIMGILSGTIDGQSQEFLDAMNPLYLQSGEAGSEFFNNVQFTNPWDGSLFAVINDDYLTWLQTYGANQVTFVNKTTKKITKDIIEQGLINGDSTSKIADDLVEQIEQYSKTRATTIALTETHNSFSRGNFMSAKASAFENKTWVTCEDSHVRPAHAAIDGMTILIGEEFLPGLAYPGDSNASAALVINCRCILTYS
jgi:polyhydroxyalkanoate synthesis regulator phasin